MKKKVAILLSLFMMGAAPLVWTGCKKKSDNNNTNVTTGAVALSIQSGAQTTEPGSPLTYSAVVIDAQGNATPASGVTWSASNSLGSFAGGVFTPSGEGSGTITASLNVNGKTLTAQVPVGVYLPAVFSVVPSAIVWSTNAGNIPLIPAYLGTETVTSYTYSSNNTSVASVDGSGSVSFSGTGECIITVKANGLSGNNTVYIPVLVVGIPTASLPVTRVTVTPPGSELFRGETVNLTAKAFNGSNNEISATFTWASLDPDVASVDANGKVTAKQLGTAVITATTNGITGQSEINVLPDTTIIVTPVLASLSPGGTKQFTAQAYAVNHSTRQLSVIPMPPGLTWSVPATGLSIFDIATVNSSGLVTMNSSATTGLSTVVVASLNSPTIDDGVALIMVSDCNCGTTTPGVTHISVSSGGTLSIPITGGPVSVSAQALDAGNNPVSGATLSMCSDDISVCSVDHTTNTLVPAGPGTATITICNGSIQTTIVVTVTL